MANDTTIESKTVLGVPYTVATFTLQNKYKVSGYIDDKKMVARVETWVDHYLLGDLHVEVVYSDYQDFAFNTSFETSKTGSFSFFGITGRSKSEKTALQRSRHGHFIGRNGRT